LLCADEGENVQQQYKDMQQQLQDNMQVAAPNVANNQVGIVVFFS